MNLAESGRSHRAMRTLSSAWSPTGRGAVPAPRGFPLACLGNGCLSSVDAVALSLEGPKAVYLLVPPSPQRVSEADPWEALLGWHSSWCWLS